MDRLTQENAHLAEQSAQAARTLDAEAERMARLLAQFTVGDRDRPARARAA
jgi:methyl-accepting chemotaxis protein